MKRLGVLGIIAGAALLTAVPLSIEWSQKNVGSAAPTLTLSQADAATAGMERRQTRRTARRAGRETRRAGPRGTGPREIPPLGKALWGAPKGGPLGQWTPPD